MGHKVEKTYSGLRRITARLRLFVCLSIGCGVLAGIGWMSEVTLGDQEREQFGRYLYVSYLVSNDMNDPVVFALDGQKYRATPANWRAVFADEYFGGQSVTDVLRGPLYVGGVTAVAAFALMSWWGWSPRTSEKDRALRGSHMATKTELQRELVLTAVPAKKEKLLRWLSGGKLFRVSPWRMARWLRAPIGINVGGICLLKEHEQSHMVILGDSGSGKSTLIRTMLAEVRRRGEPAIIYDPEGEFLQMFYRQGDIVLNPVDGRMRTWSPKIECTSRDVAEGIAASFCPDVMGSHNKFWTDSARTLFVDLLMSTSSYDPGEMAEACALPLDVLSKRLKGTAAAAALSPSAPQMAESIRGTLMVATRGLGLLPKPCGMRPLVSLRDWAANPSGWIYLTRTKETAEATKPLTTAWLDILIRGLLSRPIGATPQVWVFADEVQTLGRMQNLLELYTQGRKRGVCGVVGSQSFTDFKANYGEQASTFVSQASTKVIYRCSEPALSKWASELVGSVERVGVRASVRADLGRGGDSTTLSEERRIEPLLLPSEIAGLANYQAYFLFRGQVCRLSPRNMRSDPRVAAFIPRPIFEKEYKEPDTALPDQQNDARQRPHKDVTPGALQGIQNESDNVTDNDPF